MFAEHPRGLESTKSPKPEPRIQIPAQAGSSGRLPASLHLPFLIFKGVVTSILPEAPIRASETDLTLLFPSSPHLTIGESGGLYLQIIWNPITSSSPPPLLRGNTARHFPALSASTWAPDSFFSAPFTCLPVPIMGKFKAFMAHGPAIWPPLTRRLVSYHPPLAQSVDTKERPALMHPRRCSLQLECSFPDMSLPRFLTFRSLLKCHLI